MLRMRAAFVVHAAMFVTVIAGCSDLGPATAPTVSATASPNPNNNLSALIQVQTTRADSLRVVPAPGSVSFTSTPWFAANGGATQVPLLGLHERSSYSAIVEAAGPGGVTQSAPIAITTGDLPESLRSVRITTVRGTATTGFNYAALDTGHWTRRLRRRIRQYRGDRLVSWLSEWRAKRRVRPTAERELHNLPGRFPRVGGHDGRYIHRVHAGRR